MLKDPKKLIQINYKINIFGDIRLLLTSAAKISDEVVILSAS